VQKILDPAQAANAADLGADCLDQAACARIDPAFGSVIARSIGEEFGR
jgi:hypothetical protein